MAEGLGMGQIITSTTEAMRDAEKVSSLQRRRQPGAAGRQIVRMTPFCKGSSLAHLLGTQP